MPADTITVRVALIGAPERDQYDLITDDERAQPYRERPKVQLDVSAQETLGDVLERAARELGVAEHPSAFIAFYRPEDEDGFARPWQPVVTLTDDHGRATWNHWYHEVPYERLIAAGEAGALDGDPLRPYLILQPGIGNGVMPDWPTLKALWDAVSYVASNIDAFGGTGAAIYAAKKLLDRLRKGSQQTQEVIERRGSEWASRGGEPYAMLEFLDDRPWHSRDLAELLGCSVEEAEALLWSFGFKVAPSGLWRRNLDQESKVVGSTMQYFARFNSLHTADQDQLRRAIRQEIETYLETGEARTLEDRERDWME